MKRGKRREEQPSGLWPSVMKGVWKVACGEEEDGHINIIQ